MEKEFLRKYFDRLSAAMIPSDLVLKQLLRAKGEIVSAQRAGSKIVVIGNGGSAAIASHVSVDLTKAAGLKAVNFNEASLLTCLSNDFGYEHGFAKAIEFYGDPGDVLIAISSSGESENILNGVRQAKKLKFRSTITLSGMNSTNPLSKSGDINFWVDSNVYNIIENTHQIWMLSLVDMIVEQFEYSANAPS